MSSRLHRRPIAVLLALLLLVGCSISEQQEIQMGRQLHPKFEQQFGGKVPDAAVQQYVDSVGQRMAQHAGRPNLDWQFAVLNSDEVNAFAVPGGYIYITQGLLSRLENEAQLAGVLGHEAAHVAKRHSVRQLERARATQGVSAVVGVVGSVFGVGSAGSLAGLALNLSNMKYGRGQEKESDLEGLRYMTAAGYNPRGMVETMQIMQSAAKGKGGPEFLSSHPNPGNRVEYLTEAIEKKYPAAAQQNTFAADNFRRGVTGRSYLAVPAGGGEPSAPASAMQPPPPNVISRPRR